MSHPSSKRLSSAGPSYGYAPVSASDRIHKTLGVLTACPLSQAWIILEQLSTLRGRGYVVGYG